MQGCCEGHAYLNVALTPAAGAVLVVPSKEENLPGGGGQHIPCVGFAQWRPHKELTSLNGPLWQTHSAAVAFAATAVSPVHCAAASEYA
jgi:hypothetical protein